LNVIDNEMKKVFICYKYTGEVKVDGDEVTEVKWIDIEQLKEELKKDEGQFTPWFLSDLKFYLSNK
jgi:isopentenyldiphosphate isomerase